MLFNILKNLYLNADDGGTGGGNPPPATAPKVLEVEFFGEKLSVPESLAESLIKARQSVKGKMTELETKAQENHNKHIAAASTKEEFEKVLAENNKLKEQAIAEANSKVKSMSKWAIKSELTTKVAAVTNRNLSDPTDKVLINEVVRNLMDNFDFDPDQATIITVDKEGKKRLKPDNGQMVGIEDVVQEFIKVPENSYFQKVATSTKVGGDPVRKQAHDAAELEKKFAEKLANQMLKA